MMREHRGQGPRGGPRRDILGGNWLCSGCGHNLRHQPLIRDEGLNLVLVRCPECGQAAAITDFPYLGKWEGAAAAMLALLWSLAAVGVAIGSAGLIFLVCIGSAWTAVEEKSSETTLFGGFSIFLISMWLVAFAVAFVLGAFWRILLLRHRAVVQIIAVAAVVILSASFGWNEVRTWFANDWYWYLDLRMHGLPGLTVAAVLVAIGYGSGYWSGRRIASWLYAHLLLPRRLRYLAPFTLS